MNLINWDGEPISRPGIYSGVPMDRYHGDLCVGPSVSSSTLRTAENESLEHAFEKSYLNPAWEPEPPSEHFSFGRAVHTLMLGEDGFRKEFLIRPEVYPDGAVYPDGEGKPKPWIGSSLWCKAWLKEAAEMGRTVLRPDAIDHIRRMAEKANAHPAIQAGLLHGYIEKSVIYQDVTGLWVKTRPDAIPTDSAVIVDYKTCADAGPSACRRAISDYGYHQQLALAGEAIFQVTGRRPQDYFLVFQEKTAPYSINIKPVDPTAIEYGRRQNRRALDKIAKAVETGIWTGYEDDEVPAFLTKFLADRLAQDAKEHLLPALQPDKDTAK